jgi:hypothetical protein
VRTLNTRALACGAGLLLSGTFLSTEANAQATVTCPTFPNTQSSGCGAIINITGTGAPVTPGPATGPYDGSDDTLVGVVNDFPKCTPGLTPQPACGLVIYSLDLSSTTNICGFDFDGIDTYGAPSNSHDTTGYGGPNAYFTPIPPATSINPNKCRVNFVTPLKPGDSAYFSLENSLSNASACTNVINNALQTQASGANICATFTPKQNFTLIQAATLCGFKNFDWTQQDIRKDDPSPFYARNLGGAFDPTISGPVRLTSKRVPWWDPPQGGGYAQNAGGGAAPDNSYPFYYDQNAELPGRENGSAVAACTLAVTPAGNVLTFHDAPSNSCLPGGASNGTATCTDPVNAPGLTAEPAGSHGGWQTHLAGVNSDGTATDLGIGFTWTSNYNGTTGNVMIDKTNLAADNNGTGGATITSVNQTSTYTGVGVTAINGNSNIFGPTSLLTAALPESRSVQVNGTATAFATIINTGANTATSCFIAPASGLTGSFVYQTTNPNTNAVIGSPNTPANIAAGASQSFVIALTPTAAIVPVDVGFNFACTNTSPAPIVTGLNTLLFSASTTPTPDVVALAATAKNDGIVHVPGASGTGAFAVATVNLGAGGSITAAANTGAATLPLTITMCQTNPKTGQCLQTPSPKVPTIINAGTTPTFAVFVAASGTVPFDPANSRVFVQFTDSTNAVRGETSVAVETQ